MLFIGIDENLRTIMKGVSLLKKENLNISPIVEKTIAPIVLGSLEQMLQERILFDNKEKGLRKHV